MKPIKNNRRNIRLGILWADPYCNNLGVAALAYSAILLFEEVSDRTGVRFDYTLWGSSRCGRNTIETGKDPVLVRTVRPFLGGDPGAFIRRCFGNPLRTATPLFALDFLRFDLVADIGAGDSYSDIYGITRFRNVDFTKSWSRRLHKKYILLPQTLGPFAGNEARTKAARSMDRADLVFARDKMSFDCAQAMLPDKEIAQAIDVAFFLPYVRPERPAGKIRAGVNVSGLLWHGGYTEDNQFDLRSDYRQTMLGILDYLSGLDDVEVHLISHVIGRQDPIDEDSHVVVELRAKYPGAVVAPRFGTPIEAKSYIAGMDFFAGARMHACIAAISSGVPVYPMAYSRKFNGLFRETLGYAAMGDLTAMDTAGITAGLRDAFDKRNELKQEIERIGREIIEPEKGKMIEKLSEYIRTRYE